MRIAIIKRALHLPARAGSDLHTYQMAKAWVEAGHEVEYFVWESEGCEELEFPVRRLEIDRPVDETADLGIDSLQRRLCRFMGAASEEIAAARRTLTQGRFDVCVAAGVEELFYLDGLDAARVWYPADEAVFAALSQLQLGNSWSENYALSVEALAVLLIERLWRRTPDASWVVSDLDRRWLDAITGRSADVIANGVDLDFFQSTGDEPEANRLAFWGRLDYGPNEQGLEWFFGNVWGPLRERRPEVRLSVIGFSPSEKVRALADRPGVDLRANVPDLRPVACSAAVAIYPLISGGGIRNKLLEGAAMARALVVTPRTIAGLPGAEEGVWALCRTPSEWVEQLDRLLADPAAARELGLGARRWAEKHSTWRRAAELGEASMRAALERRQARTA